MLKDWKITYFKPDRPGVFYKENSVCFAVDFGGNKECALILYDKTGGERNIPFSANGINGTLAGIEVETDSNEAIYYNYRMDGQLITDIYAPEVRGLEHWGDRANMPRKTMGVAVSDSFEWEEDMPLRIPYENSIIYGLDIRSYTMHKSSGVKYNGTFEGLVEKIPYLKSLGITAVELLPCYEYEECMTFEKQVNVHAKNKEDKHTDEECNEGRLNCWGFQEGYYFAPKASYSAYKTPVISFKNLIRQMHKNGIEVLMQFYFPPEMKALYILDVLKYWTKEYHVDGFRISGISIPYRILIEDPVLKYTKMRFQYLQEEEMVKTGIPMKNIAVDNHSFFVDMRKYLKGDEGEIGQVIALQKSNPKTVGCINYLTDYNSFSLYDMVSYEYKHNEANGEENKDGSDFNYSWNCGVEGESRKKTVVQLRIKQMKNALALLFLSQGTPYLFGGDELANTRFGNNNPYCQDNEIGWVKWKETKISKEITEYTKELIRLRMTHKILHMPEELKVMDAIGCGMPDISYHGVEAWRPDLGHMSRMIGIMLCGIYAGEEDSWYIASNMHWEAHQMALPKLPKDMMWKKVWDTSFAGAIMEETVSAEDFTINVEARSIVIYRTCKVTMTSKKQRKKAVSDKD